MKHTVTIRLAEAVGLLFGLALVLALGTLVLVQAQTPAPQGTALGTAFTYQGLLTDTNTGQPIAGPCDLRFTLYQSLSGDDPEGQPQELPNVPLNNGYFAVDLDFGAAAFDGEGRFLKIEADCGEGYKALSPRVALRPAPYALYATSTGALHQGPVSDSAPAQDDLLAWNGSAWTPTRGDNLAWSLSGNSDTTPGTNFLGTTDGQALEFHVNGARALQLQPNTVSPNIVAGYSGNSVANGLQGATVAGGGFLGFPNHVTAHYGTVSGGYENTASGRGASIGGGGNNTAGGEYAAIAGGSGNTTSGFRATVGGGLGNTAGPGEECTVAGGANNTASGAMATVGGGRDNSAVPDFSTVPGGVQARTASYGQWAYASGRFEEDGDAQASIYVLRNTTTSNTPRFLGLDGAAEEIAIPLSTTVMFDILVAARSKAGESAGYYVWGVAENEGGDITVWNNTVALHEDDTTWNAMAVQDDTYDALAIQVTGHADKEIRWVATVRTTQVSW